MASNRKLLAEVDRTLKKVQEGVELFDDIYEKVYDASSTSLKEKHEADLKKEIKKLQRLRDSIKGWISNTDIKDDTQLVEAKKLIEVKMEQFKVCERETKTKTYSKEGLAKAARYDEEDEEETEEPESWVHEILEKLEKDYEEMMSEIKLLESSRKRKDQKKVASNQRKTVMHKFHIDQLRLVIQCMEKDALSLDELDVLKDDLDSYVEHCTESGYELDEEVYVHLELEDRLECAIQAEEDAKGATAAAIAKAAEEEKAKKEKEADEKRKKEHQQLLKAQQDRARILKDQEEAKRLRKEQQAKEKERREKLKQDNAKRQVAPPQPSAAAVVAGAANTAAASVPSPAVPAATPTDAAPSMETEPLPAPVATDATEPVAQTNGAAPTAQTAPNGIRGIPAAQTREGLLQARYRLLENSMSFIPDLNDSGQLAHEKQDRLLASQEYYPRHPTATPRSFPQAPLKLFRDPQVFQRMDSELLFFIFYHQQGSYQQYLASRELKKQSWRYHKKYLTWFQRHEEPKRATPEYEVGTYIYFDYESGWCKRIKSEFTFEYVYLEDDSN